MIQRWVVVLAGLNTLGSFAACGGDDPYAGLASRAEEVRELSLLEPVPTRTLTREQFAYEVEADNEEVTEAELREYADTYGRLGFFDVDLDLRPILTQSRLDATGAFYRLTGGMCDEPPCGGDITFVGDPRDDTVVHEYVHAIQDQSFGLRAYDLESSDGFLARRAVVEGDATLAETRFSAESRGFALEEVTWPDYIQSWRLFTADSLDQAEYPVIFRAYLAFAYSYGIQYSAANLFGADPVFTVPTTAGNWRRQDELFTTRPPATTAEIVAQNDPVLAVGISALPASLTDDLEAAPTDVLGYWYTYLLFYQWPERRSLATAWDGDRVLFAKDKVTGEVGVLWASVWDTPEAAAAVELALHDLHDAEGEPLVIERRDDRVVLARNFSPTFAAELVPAAFAGDAPGLVGGTAPSAARRPPLHVREALRHTSAR